MPRAVTAITRCSRLRTDIRRSTTDRCYKEGNKKVCSVGNRCRSISISLSSEQGPVDNNTWGCVPKHLITQIRHNCITMLIRLADSSSSRQYSSSLDAFFIYFLSSICCVFCLRCSTTRAPTVGTLVPAEVKADTWCSHRPPTRSGKTMSGSHPAASGTSARPSGWRRTTALWVRRDKEPALCLSSCWALPLLWVKYWHLDIFSTLWTMWEREGEGQREREREGEREREREREREGERERDREWLHYYEYDTLNLIKFIYFFLYCQLAISPSVETSYWKKGKNAT